MAKHIRNMWKKEIFLKMRRRRWEQGWRSMAIAGVRDDEGCVDDSGPETREAPQGQWVGDGGHELTEPESEPKRAVAWRRRWRCPELRGLEQVYPRSSMDRMRGVWWTSHSRDQRSTPHRGQWASDGGHGLIEPEPEPRRAVVHQRGGDVHSDVGGRGHAVMWAAVTAMWAAGTVTWVAVAATCVARTATWVAETAMWAAGTAMWVR